MEPLWRIKYKIDGCDLIHGLTVKARDEMDASTLAIQDAREKRNGESVIIQIKSIEKVEK